MIEHGATPKDLRLALLEADGSLLVLRPPQAAPRPAPGQPGVVSDYVSALPDIFLALRDDGSVLAFNGHVDLGTGIRTALGQLVAEELDLPMAQVQVLLGHTEAAPNQGPTIASSTIQISAMPLRRAAAQARAWLAARAADRLGVAVAALDAADGSFFVRGEAARRIGYGELLAGERVRLALATDFPLKPAADHRLVGRSAPRVDIPAKATGALSFVHDMRLPGMLHGRVIRPPYAGIDCGDFVGRSLVKVHADSIRHLPGIVDVVVIGDFVGVVAEREEQAIRAMKALKVEWQPLKLPVLDDIDGAIRAIPATRRPLKEEGDTDAALAGAATVLERHYAWPYQMHGSIGPSCALADWRADGLTVWSGTQNPHMLRVDLARLLKRDEGDIEVVRMEAAGCYGRNCADDVVADAALLSRAVGRPVRVQLSREQEHAWEPKGAGQLMDVKGALAADGSLAAYDFLTRYPSNDAPLLALLLTGAIEPAPRMLEMGDRTAVPPYAYPNMRIACDDVPAIVRAGWLRGVSALPNSFAHDSFIDELAEAAGADKVDFRLRHLPDARAADLLRAVAERADWQTGQRGGRGQPGADGLLRGRGVAYARYVHSKFPGFGAAWSAWVIDVAVDPASGALTVERLVVGQDTGMMVNPDGVRHQIHGNVLQTLSRMLKEEVRFAEGRVAAREWGAYPILGFAEVPRVEVLLMPRQDEAPLGAGESASVPGAAAVANALFDATGVRFRRPPFTRACIREALG
ncbi:aldehyde dehydrogenase [Azoarcus sp. DD4]|uniref:xanthine dehydrogenase family protein molybdopterin-binding subunit n=1 Tax=Azoarcus sp. DD4 TaxID=2027405 RepID=UPI001126EA8B|nr:molybdopterin cofactor-binding domain-containing protein [Azoarcus sp. DD4]QDF99031.1 aldehyde dehydrogenase [Azoarcus sp. DD4]